MDLSAISDDELFGRIEALAETERFSLTDFLIHLGELDERPACQRKGYASVFAYLTRRLGYAECDAMRRVRAARAVRIYPSIVRMLAKGEIHLVGVALLQPILDSKNHESLLRKACRRTTREIERMVADLLPAAKEPRARIRALPPAPQPAPAPMPSEGRPQSGVMNSVLELSPAGPPILLPLERRERVLFTFPADEQVHSWFKEAQDLLRHKYPRGLMEEIIGEALRRLVEEERPGQRRRRGSRPEPRDDNVRRIPRWIQDEVWRRDAGRCTFLSPEGIRCGETAWLEFDHIMPFAIGGRSDDPANIRLLCRAHNQSEALRVLGAERDGGML